MSRMCVPASVRSRHPFIFNLIVIFFLFHSLSFAQRIFPSWFKKLPEMPPGYYISVGYSGKFVNPQLGKLTALDLAIKNLCRQKRIRLKFRLEEIADGRLRISHPSYEIIYGSGAEYCAVGDFKILDSLYTKDAYFVLVVSPADIDFEIKKEILSDWGPRPDWVDCCEGARAGEYGLGVVSRYAYWTRAWQDADAFAYFDLAKARILKVESIYAKEHLNYVIESKILKQECDTELENCAVVERWYDKERDIYYSLCTQIK